MKDFIERSVRKSPLNTNMAITVQNRALKNAIVAHFANCFQRCTLNYRQLLHSVNRCLPARDLDSAAVQAPKSVKRALEIAAAGWNRTYFQSIPSDLHFLESASLNTY
jgi:hypothetical protein